MDQGATKIDLPIVIKPALSVLWVWLCLLAAFGVICLYVQATTENVPAHLEFLLPSLIVLWACLSGLLFFAIESSSLVLSKEQLYSRQYFSVKRVSLPRITNARIGRTFNHRHAMVVTVLDERGRRDIALNIGLYNPKECRRLLKVLKEHSEPRIYLLKVLKMRSVM